MSDPTTRTYRLALPGRGFGEVFVMEFGTADRAVDIVFLHANGFNARTYRHILAPLGARFRLIAFDQRGHGASSLTASGEGRGDWLDLRDDLLAMLEGLDLRDVVLSGHSMGGTACLLAAAETNRVRRLVLFDPVVLPHPIVEGTLDSPMVQSALRRRPRFADREAAFKAYRGRGAFRTWPEGILRDYLEAGLQPTAEGDMSLTCVPVWEASNYAAQGHDSWAALGATTIPIDIFTAETGSTFRREGAPDLAAFAPRLRVETVAGSTHFLPMERRDLVCEALTAAVLETSGAARRVASL